MTRLLAIQQRDAEYESDDDVRALACVAEDLGAEAVKDRRWLLGVVEELGRALSCYEAHHSLYRAPCDCADCRHARTALALLATPEHAEKT